MISIFSLHALAARKLLQQRKFLRRCAAGKPVIHANRSGRKTLKEQVAYKAKVTGLTKLVVHIFSETPMCQRFATIIDSCITDIRGELVG